MASRLGARIALIEARLATELAELVRRHGAEPVTAPALQEIALDRPLETAAFIQRLAAGTCRVGAFLRGAGTTRLFEEVEDMHLLPDLRIALQGMTTVCRGSTR